MMVSGIPTASGYEERIRFSELEVVDAGAIDHGVLATLPEGHYVNGWDVNVAGVRTTLVKRNIRYHKHAVSPHWPLNVRQVLITKLGVHSASQEKGGDGFLYWKTLRRFQQTSQKTPDGAARKSAPTDAEEEQAKLCSLKSDERGYWE